MQLRGRCSSRAQPALNEKYPSEIDNGGGGSVRRRTEKIWAG